MNAAMASASFFLAIYSMDKKKYKRSKGKVIKGRMGNERYAIKESLWIFS
jgi:hypothetical protein